jgi:hypothetical protein
MQKLVKSTCASTPLAGCSCSLLMADLRCSAPPPLAPPAAGAPPAPPRCNTCFGDDGAPRFVTLDPS